MASNIEFEFKGLSFSDLPLNFSVKDFEHLNSVKYEVIPWGAQGRGARVTCRYNHLVSNDTAEEQTDTIANMVLEMFNQQQLNCFSRQRGKDSSTGELVVLRDHGYFSDDIIPTILNHKPQGGFSDLITEDLLNLYRTYSNGVLHFGVVHLEYTMDEFSWDFNFGICTDLSWSGSDAIIELDINEMIAAEAIAASSGRKSLISLVLYKSYRRSAVTYSMSLDSIMPPDYTGREEDENTLVVTYDLSLLGPLEVNAKVKISATQSESYYNKLFILLAIILAIIVGSFVTVFMLLRKRKRRKTREEKPVARNGAVIMFNYLFAKYGCCCRTAADRRYVFH
ncbi:MAG: hypothetical protein QHH24_02890 [Candidatus Bathyarchaeota archaeon]|nr:hypothetical protein [Candidatus Bathyarchaeota archaeon]